MNKRGNYKDGEVAYDRAKYKRLTFKVDRLTWEKLAEEERKKRIEKAREVLKSELCGTHEDNKG